MGREELSMGKWRAVPKDSFLRFAIELGGKYVIMYSGIYQIFDVSEAERMEIIRSRQNELVRRFRALGSDGELRRQEGEFIGAGQKLLDEAEKAGADITMVLAAEPVQGHPHRVVSPEILDYVSPLKNSPGPVFTVKMRRAEGIKPQRAIVLENLQDPGNVGTVLRTADALGVELVVLCGACADPWGPKAARASMGAIFRQNVVSVAVEELPEALGGLALYGAALSPTARDIRALDDRRIAVAIGNEGHGLSKELLEQCAGQIIIPMRPQAESLNAAVAAALCMWELVR